MSSVKCHIFAVLGEYNSWSFVLRQYICKLFTPNKTKRLNFFQSRRRLRLCIQTIKSSAMNTSIQAEKSNRTFERYETSFNQSRSMFLTNETISRDLESDKLIEKMSMYDSLPDNSTFFKLHPTAVKEKTNQLYEHFLEIAQTLANDTEIFESVENMIEACTETIDDLLENGGTLNEKNLFAGFGWLNQERNTWKLLYCLYKDRLLSQQLMDEGNIDDLGLYTSEREIIEKLYKQNGNLREYQLIVDWLEQCEIQSNAAKCGHYMDETVSWENTLHQLQNIDHTAFSGKKNIVKSLDPDAPNRENLPLHDLDAEDEERISKEILYEIRHGRLDEAGSLCERVGQYWRAAILEGWRLYNDPNYKVSEGSLEKFPVEGNVRRDLWKRLAWQIADNCSVNEYTRAYLGVFCGHLDALKSVLHQSWFDLLWVYLKVQIDIRVETELRSTSTKSYLDMPPKYWKNKITIEEIFDELGTRDNIRDIAEHKMTIIRKYIILDDIQELMLNINKWIDDLKTDGQMLRFITHIVLFMRRIGRQNQENIGNNVIEAYVEYLISESAESSLVAFYTASLPNKIQIDLFAKYLENISHLDDRKMAIEVAHNNRLDIHDIITCMVQMICSKQQSPNSAKELTGVVSALDEKKISALEWLTLSFDQYSELLWHGNNLIRNFLAENKIESVRKIFKIIPNNVTQQICKTYGSKEFIPAKTECSISEYVCYLLYINALDAHDAWLRVYHSKPKEPEKWNENAPFTERIANEHKKQTFLNELKCWKINLIEQTTVTQAMIRKALFPPEKGFLIDPDTANQFSSDEKSALDNRLQQLYGIRKLCIPQLVSLLHNILHSSGDYKGAIKIVDELVSEDCQLYSVYSKNQLTEIVGKVAESSLAALNEKMDPWGYHPSS